MRLTGENVAKVRRRCKMFHVERRLFPEKSTESTHVPRETVVLAAGLGAGKIGGEELFHVEKTWDPYWKRECFTWNNQQTWGGRQCSTWNIAKKAESTEYFNRSQTSPRKVKGVAMNAGQELDRATPILSPFSLLLDLDHQSTGSPL